jgi:protein-S-isoprenylcysteine O-methyltransferase Ste14
MATILWSIRSLFAQWIVVFYPGVLVFWLLIHSNIERLRPWGTRAYWIAAFAWIMTAGPVIYFRREIFSVRWTSSDPVDAIVVIIGVLAFAIASATLSQAFQRIPLKTLLGFPEIDPTHNKQTVLSAGIYSKTRNPVYFGHWLLVFSSAAVSGFAANWVLFALDSVILPLLIYAEERELLSRYGYDFQDYMRRVPRFFPRLR